MATTIYATTRAGFYDTKAIAKGKWLQQKKSPSAVAAGKLSEPENTNAGTYDCKVRTLQRILLVEQ